MSIKGAHETLTTSCTFNVDSANMETILKITQVCFFFVITDFWTKAIAKEIIISNSKKSRDQVGCGSSLASPCASIGYATSFWQDGDVISLDTSERHTFYVNSSFDFNGSLVLRRYHRGNNTINKSKTTSPTSIINAEEMKDATRKNHEAIVYLRGSIGPTVFTFTGKLSINSIKFRCDELCCGIKYFIRQKISWKDNATNSHECTRREIILENFYSPRILEFIFLTLHSKTNKTTMTLRISQMICKSLDMGSIVVTDSIVEYSKLQFHQLEYTCVKVCIKNSIFDSVALISIIGTKQSNVLMENVSIRNKLPWERWMSNYHFNVLLVKDTNLNLTNCSFQNAAVESSRGIVRIVNSTFFKLSKYKRRSALEFYNSDVQIINVTFSNNVADSGIPSFILQSNGIMRLENVFFQVDPKTGKELIRLSSQTIISCIRNVTIQSTKGSLKHRFLFPHKSSMPFEVKYQPCQDGNYSLSSASLYWGSENENMNLDPIEIGTKCTKCPREAVCHHGNIKSKGGYWGYTKSSLNSSKKNNQDEIMKSIYVEFVTCPPYFCCASITKCKSYNTCMGYRQGTLCSQCPQGFSTSINGDYECLRNNECKNLIATLFVYFAASMMYLILILYLKEIILLLKRLFKPNDSMNGRSHSRRSRDSGDSMTFVERQDDDDVIEPIFQEHFFDECYVQGYSSAVPYQLIQPRRVSQIESDDYKQSQTIVSGMLKILFFFYQCASVIRIQTSAKVQLHTSSLVDFIFSLFNLKMSLEYSKFPLCVHPDMGVLQVKVFRMGFIFIILATLGILALGLVIYKHYNRTKSSETRRESDQVFQVIDARVPVYAHTPFSVRLKCTYIHFLLIGFSSITMFSLQCLYCVKIRDQMYLYVQASTTCFQVWQYGMALFTIFWVLPFPAALFIGTRLLYHCNITPNEFLFGITFPPILLWYLLRCKINRFRKFELTKRQALSAKKLLELINEPFKDVKESSQRRICWESSLILRRSLLMIIKIFVMHPIVKLYPLTVLLLIYTFHNIVRRPYRDEILNNVAIASLLILLSLSFANMFWAVTREYTLLNDLLYEYLGRTLLYYEMFILLLPIILLVIFAFVYILRLVWQVCKRRLKLANS